MKNSSAMHLLGLLLASAATASMAVKPLMYFDEEEPNRPMGVHGGRDAQGVPDHRFHTHDMLERHVVGGDAGRFHEARGVEAEEAELLHPLPHYLTGFFKWTYNFGVGLTGWSSMEDGLHALKNYARADDKIALHDAEKEGYTLSHNAYSHMSWQEFRNHFHIGQDMVVPAERAIMKPRGKTLSTPMLRVNLPDEVDWTTKGGVTEVKNQGACGSCWSFSTTGAMEGAHFIKTGSLDQFSEQELVDCDSYDMGCNGGLMDNSFHWIQQNHGICSETDYPYTASGNQCDKDSCTVVPGTEVDNWVDVDHDSEEALMMAVAQQPVSIAIEADEMSFQLYSGGVLTAQCGTNLDHGVLLVGYGTSDDGIKYWKVKNSWGGEWGMSGYILLKREASQEGGECGILEQASYPVLV